jgi:hypothetical protein
MCSLLALPAGVRYNPEFFCASVLPDIERNRCYGKRRKTLRGTCLHPDNAPAHNIKRPPQEIAGTKANQVAHPIHSLDGAPSDFFLLGHLRGEMAGFTASSAEDIPSVLRRIFEDSQRRFLSLTAMSGS